MRHRGHMGHGMGGEHKTFSRKFYTKEEKKQWISKYIEELKKEIEAAEQKLNEM